MASMDQTPLIARLERVRDLATDLAREVGRGHSHTAIASDMAAVIKEDIDEAVRILNQKR